ncbi:MAG: reverse transcriptase domain-containing protein, partial [Cetobacterium sp.]
MKEGKHPKMKNKGVKMMFVGYPDDHPADCFTMWDPQTERTHFTRDVIFLRKLYFAPAIGAGEGRVRHLTNIYEHLNDENSDEEAEQEDDDEPSLVDEIDDVDDDYGINHDNSDESSANHETREGNNNLINNDPVVVTKSGRISVPVNRVGFDTLGNLQYPMITNAEADYYRMVERFPGAFGHDEICMVGAGLGGGFINTQELHVMKFEEAMAGPEADKWEVAVDKEHSRMVKSEVFKATPIADLPEGATVLTETWAMKKKASGDHRARVTARGFEQIDGEHFDMNDKAAPVVTEATIRIVFTLILMAAWYAYVLDVVGAFLLGKF